MHDCIDVIVYLFSSSRPIIERCRNIRFAEYFPLNQGDHDLASDNLYSDVQDFDAPLGDSLSRNKNWSVIREDRSISDLVSNFESGNGDTEKQIRSLLDKVFERI